MQFSRVVTPVEDIKIWNANSNGFSFVISYESRNGPGFQGNPGFLASWRPIFQNRTAVKVIGSPFKTRAAAEQACEVMLGYLMSDSTSSRRAALSIDILTHVRGMLAMGQSGSAGWRSEQG
jgi:hypothetical protein